MNQIIDTLTELSIDPFALDAYARDPGGFLAAAGVAPEIRAPLMRGDRQALESRLPGGSWARCAGCTDPGPDPLPEDPPDVTAAIGHV